MLKSKHFCNLMVIKENKRKNNSWLCFKKMNFLFVYNVYISKCWINYKNKTAYLCKAERFVQQVLNIVMAFNA